MTKSDDSLDGRMRQIECGIPRTSPSHWSACCATSAISVRPTKPSSSRRRAASDSASSADGSSTATRTRGTPVYGDDPLRFVAGLVAGRRAPLTATSAAGGCASLELSPEGGVFSNDFLIPLALDRGLGHRRN